MNKNYFIAFLSSIIALLLSTTSYADQLRVGVTTSFYDSGLADALRPEIIKDTGIEVHFLVVGSGQAIQLARRGDVDAILVHSKKAEQKLIMDGFVTHRRAIMYNDFIFIGPKDDPANIRVADSAIQAITKIAKSRNKFVSRGDKSGTHAKELSLWKKINYTTNDFSPDWYLETGSGMGATLNIAASIGAYLISDRASWLRFSNKSRLQLLYSGDPSLFNQYNYLPVNPKIHSQANYPKSLKLESWLTSAKGQKLINSYHINGKKLFTANAAQIK